MKNLIMSLLLVSTVVFSTPAGEWIWGEKLPDPINRLLNDRAICTVAGTNGFDAIIQGYIGGFIKCHRDGNGNWTMLGNVTSSQPLLDIDVNKYQPDKGFGIDEATKKLCRITTPNQWFYWEVVEAITG